MDELALFAGAGGGILGGKLLGWRTVCAVEVNPFRIQRLLDRQRDGCLERFPIWDDIRTFDGFPWRGSIDIISGGFPCQDISSAGTRKGLAGSRSSLWFEMLRVIGEVRPPFVLAENSPQLRTRGLGTILQGLDGLGYDARWGVLGAWHVGANHRRNRMWIVAVPKGQQVGSGGQPRQHGSMEVDDRSWWNVDCFSGVDDGMADRVERVKATGDGQVPAVVALAWEVLGGQ